MTQVDQEERKGLRRVQNVVVVVVLLVLSAVAIKIVLINEPQRWRETEQDVALSTFSDAVGLVRAEWLRKGKPETVSLRVPAEASTGMIKVNAEGWPAVENGCLVLWQKLGGDIPVSALNGYRQGQQCYFELNGDFWFRFDAHQGRLQRNK